jgi:hypothetical protein
MFDTYRGLPHRDIYVRYAAAGDTPKYEHRPCGMELTEADVKEGQLMPALCRYDQQSRAAPRRTGPPVVIVGYARTSTLEQVAGFEGVGSSPRRARRPPRPPPGPLSKLRADLV